MNAFAFTFVYSDLAFGFPLISRLHSIARLGYISRNLARANNKALMKERPKIFIKNLGYLHADGTQGSIGSIQHTIAAPAGKGLLW